ncbi:Glycine-rich RNA-binding protein 3, mitochondrial [Gracilariopsis chorda]|uniref:Glycine-rich RNA-binding protein 3, mitochondrial n=1 Tax=Gracilariopsis chorda TaxID=448386 RepID=A0A2V3IRQ6_9FLOR|nr:Glycine-rich RNA-binding protein 3, mitochondrial [Gracilariopsis chorda]|eukprot:PXF44783.1 Glycine-rich RNA-binding protein 3, mitochondrial [Gracilariopsis chorda]
MPRVCRPAIFPLNGARSFHASRRRRPSPQDEAFSTCPSCGSDEPISASQILEKGSLIVRCSQCRTRFTATAKDALTVTGAPLRESAEHADEGQNAEEDPNVVGVKLYISGLSPKVDSDVLRNTVAEFGEVTYSRVVFDRVTGRSKGFGFVTVRGKSTAAAVIDILNGDSRRLGTRLRVREAIE